MKSPRPDPPNKHRSAAQAIAAAKAECYYAGRAPTAKAKAAKVLALHAKGLSKQDIANACEMGIASVILNSQSRESSLRRLEALQASRSSFGYRGIPQAI